MGTYCVVAIVTVKGAIGPGIACIRADYTTKPKEHDDDDDCPKSNFDASLTCTMTNKSLSPIELHWSTEASPDHSAWDVSCNNLTVTKEATAEDSCEEKEKRSSHSCCGEENPSRFLSWCFF
jgi:hypothetical protein